MTKLTLQAGLNDLPPEAFLVDVATVKLADDDPKGSTPRFTMLVNSGTPMQHAWFGTLAVNLAGITWASERMPVLLDHDTSRRLGFTEKLSVEDDGLRAEGVMLANEDALAVRMDSAAGFPFQASCYLRASKILELEADAEHEVNGQKMTGPGIVFEACEMREVTFTALGADPNTTAETLADGSARVRAEVTKKEPQQMSTQESTPAPNVEPEPVDTAKLQADAAAAERTRATAILSAAADSQATLAHELVAEGLSFEDALLRLNKDLQATLSGNAEAAAANAAPAAANEPPVDDAAAKLAAMEDGEEKWKAEFAASITLQKEFAHVGEYLAYQSNDYRCRSYGDRAALNAAQEN